MNEDMRKDMSKKMKLLEAVVDSVGDNGTLDEVIEALGEAEKRGLLLQERNESGWLSYLTKANQTHISLAVVEAETLGHEDFADLARSFVEEQA
jgi:predicted DNA-binding transcriptional regulator